MKFRILLAASLFLLPVFLFGATVTFSRTLSLGMRGEDVRVLQKLLNNDVATQVAIAGAGSRGSETDYFGPATKKALTRFQEKYGNEVLVPAGLTRGTGFFGALTRAKAEKLYALVAIIPVENPITPISTTTPAAENPNLVNIEPYIAAVKRVGQKQGYSTSALSYLEAKIRKQAITTKDYRKEFFDKQKAAYEKKISINFSETPVQAFFKRVLSKIGGTIFAQKVFAAVGLPFGGFITYVNPAICDCPPGVVTQIFVALPNPNLAESNLLLNYLNGSEAFNYHNIPEPSIAVLGQYEPGVQSCITYYGTTCAPFPAEGQITPIVGSSLVP